MIRYLTSGESHGEALVGIVEGMPAGLPIEAAYINRHLARRWQGYGRGGRAKLETDRVHIYSGVRFSKTIGSPIALRLENAAYTRDRSNWPDVMSIEGDGDGIESVTLPRPGHADLVGTQKFGFDDIRPVIDRASARETAMRVACCSIARKMLLELGIEIGSHVVRIGDVGWEDEHQWADRVHELSTSGARGVYEAADESEVRMLDPTLTADAIEHIKQTKSAGDSLGGVYEVIVTGVPPGLGSYTHWDRRLDGLLGQAILSIQGQKAVEIGDGVSGSRDPGSRVHDPIIRRENHASGGAYGRTQNRAGGIEGGMSNGMPILVRGYMKPIPTLIKPLGSVDIATGEEGPTRYERSDVTSVPAASTVAEATVAHVIANEILATFGGDQIAQIRERMGR